MQKNMLDLERYLKNSLLFMQTLSFLLNVERDEKASTQKYQKHEACGYAYKRVSRLDKYDKPLKLFRGDGTHSRTFYKCNRQRI